MTVKKWLIGIVLILHVTLLPAYSATPIKAGSTCSKQGISKTYQSKKFTCIKFGKKLVWNTGVTVAKKQLIPTPTPTPSLTPTPTPTPSLTPTLISEKFLEPNLETANPSLCKLTESSQHRAIWPENVGSGFPILEKYVSHTGTIDWLLVPIDFPDKPGTDLWLSNAVSQTAVLSNWYSYVSQGKLNINWRIQKEWIRLKGQSSEYGVPYSGARPETAQFWQRVIAEIDPLVDFTKIVNIVFLLPREQTVIKESVQSFPWEDEMVNFKTNEGRITSFSLAGNYFDYRPLSLWSYWAHEFGHVLGLAHIGSSRQMSEFMNYDLMASQDGFTKELSAWMRFIAGWLPDSQIYCQDVSRIDTLELSLSPLSETESRTKVAMFRSSPNRLIIIESRRANKFSCSLNPSVRNSGVLVYVYDAKLGNQQRFLEPAIVEGRKTVKNACEANFEDKDLFLHVGENVKVDGLNILFTSSGSWDSIKITKS